MRNVLVAAALVLVAAEARAEIAVLTNGMTLKITARRVEGDIAFLTLKGGGEMGVAASLVRGVVPDEVLDEIVPGPGGDIEALAVAAARRHGLDPELVLAVIAVESAFRPNAVSPKGAQGLMQLMPFTARRFGVSDPFDPRQNIFGGVQYLRLLLDLFQGDIALSLAAYNAGENAVARYRGIPPYKETRSYVQKIQGLLEGGIEALRAAFYAPPSRPLAALPALARPAKPAKPAKVTPARPRVYYKWKDETGTLHVAHIPPAEGVVYTMIRALD
jgi:Transglycosylase SLT domain